MPSEAVTAEQSLQTVAKSDPHSLPADISELKALRVSIASAHRALNDRDRNAKDALAAAVGQILSKDELRELLGDDAPKTATRRSRRSSALVADEEEILAQLAAADDWLARDTITENLTARTEDNHADLRHQVGIVLRNLRNENPKRADTNGKTRNEGRWATPENAAKWLTTSK